MTVPVVYLLKIKRQIIRIRTLVESVATILQLAIKLHVFQRNRAEPDISRSKHMQLSPSAGKCVWPVLRLIGQNLTNQKENWPHAFPALDDSCMCLLRDVIGSS